MGSCEAVYELGRPYYSRTEPATLLICMTDGIDDLKPAANIPFKVRKNMIWLIVNDDKNHLDNIMQTLIKCGFRERNIILVDTSKLDV